jgi:hypothetical protein
MPAAASTCCKVGRAASRALACALLVLPALGGRVAVADAEPAIPPGAVAARNICIAPDRQMRRTSVLINRLTKTSWLRSPSPLYRFDASGELAAALKAEPLDDGQLRLRLTIRNTSAEPVSVQATFPLLEGLGVAGDPNKLAYCYPKSGALIGTKPVDVRRFYSGLFPLQFMDVHHPAAGGIYVMTQDLANHVRTFRLRKTPRGTADLAVEYRRRSLAPGETWALPPAVIGAHRGDWHAALAAYRRWVATWYRPAAPPKRWFREVFNFRQVFLYPNLGLKYGAFDPKTKAFQLAKMVADDAAAFGGVDFVHIFDWSQEPLHGRVGQYDPWQHLGGVAPFRREVASIQARGIPVGVYLEGYLISKKADVAAAHGEKWQMLAANGKPHARFGSGYCCPCPYVPAWRKHLAAACARVCRQAGVDGVYIDEMGFGYQYPCHRKDHGHEVPSNQRRGELGLLQAVRRAVGPKKVMYTEETPTDVTTQWLDGSFTYALAGAGSAPVRVNLTRFALPHFKTFEIIRCDRPLGNDLAAVRSIFFNDEGIWLAGPLAIDKWFPAEVRKLIAKTYRILREHRDAFCSEDPTPLVRTRHEHLHANRFPARPKVVWTLYNASDKPLRGELLEVTHVAGADYLDAWNGKPLTPRITGGRAVLRVNLLARGAGCVVQHRPGDAPRD